MSIPITIKDLKYAIEQAEKEDGLTDDTILLICSSDSCTNHVAFHYNSNTDWFGIKGDL